MEGKFNVVVPVYNGKTKIFRTLKSIIAQSNENWHAHVIDDMSEDGSFEAIYNELLGWGKFREKFTLYDREHKYGETRNVYDIVNLLPNEDVIVRLDCGDWIIEQDTLNIIESVIDREKIRLGWTSHRWSYTGKGISGPFALGSDPYKHPWVSSHMKFFRVDLFKSVPHKNFMGPTGDWIKIACDQSYMLPMMHILNTNKEKFGWLDFMAYHYDIPLEDPNLFKSERSLSQKESAEWIRARGFVS